MHDHVDDRSLNYPTGEKVLANVCVRHLSSLSLLLRSDGLTSASHVLLGLQATITDCYFGSILISASLFPRRRRWGLCVMQRGARIYILSDRELLA